MNINIDKIGIIDEVNNPFGVNKNDWIRQAFGLTKHRRTQLMPLLNKNTDEVFDHIPENDSRYPAFVAVRWGFAILSGEGRKKIIIKTEKLDDYKSYDTRGKKRF
ncbi:MAG: hypothetical protein Q8S54_14280 [Bacteroidota bacterium]|nr:hypothetical protein [Bacteroidota bacterium]